MTRRHCWRWCRPWPARMRPRGRHSVSRSEARCSVTWQTCTRDASTHGGWASSSPPVPGTTAAPRHSRTRRARSPWRPGPRPPYRPGPSTGGCARRLPATGSWPPIPRSPHRSCRPGCAPAMPRRDSPSWHGCCRHGVTCRQGPHPVSTVTIAPWSRRCAGSSAATRWCPTASLVRPPGPRCACRCTSACARSSWPWSACAGSRRPTGASSPSTSRPTSCGRQTSPTLPVPPSPRPCPWASSSARRSTPARRCCRKNSATSCSAPTGTCRARSCARSCCPASAAIRASWRAKASSSCKATAMTPG